MRENEARPRIALITGASSGMGWEFARALAAEGKADVLWLVARRRDRLDALCAELSGRVTCIPMALDLTKEEDRAALTARWRTEGVTFTWCILCAGCGYAGEFSGLTDDRIRAMTDLNCTATTALLYAAYPHLRRGSRVVLLASAAAFVPQPGFAVYAASKAYVLSLSRGVRQEWRAHGIRVTAVCPGPVSTEFLEKAYPGGAPDPRKARYAVRPERVVRGALRAASRGRAIYTPTFAMKAVRLLAKIAPHAWLMRFFTRR